jgi:hypothetical protein
MWLTVWSQCVSVPRLEMGVWFDEIVSGLFTVLLLLLPVRGLRCFGLAMLNTPLGVEVPQNQSVNQPTNQAMHAIGSGPVSFVSILFLHILQVNAHRLTNQPPHRATPDKRCDTKPLLLHQNAEASKDQDWESWDSREIPSESHNYRDLWQFSWSALHCASFSSCALFVCYSSHQHQHRRQHQHRQL